MTSKEQKLVVMIAGSRWENTRGTDHRLAEALAKRALIVWVDPPVPVAGRASTGCPPLLPGYAVDGLKPGLLRLRVAAPPGFTKPVLRSVANKLVGRAIRAVLKTLPLEHSATLVLSPRELFPQGLGGMKVLHVTDDWIAGSTMMGLSQKRVATTLQHNIDAADVVSIVSPSLRELITTHSAQVTPVVLPNGCVAASSSTSGNVAKRRLVVALVGQLNERLDFDLLDQLVASGIELEVIGPRRERDPKTRQRLDYFLQADGVTWLGEVPEGDAFARMSTTAVGITPYVDNAFNRASFPIKTLDYLAAGLQVVSTDLPAARWLDSEWVDIAGSSDDFIALVQQALRADQTEAAVSSRRSFAATHTWDARAKQLLSLIGAGDTA